MPMHGKARLGAAWQARQTRFGGSFYFRVNFLSLGYAKSNSAFCLPLVGSTDGPIQHDSVAR
jgi:hypothetical protein